MSNPDPQSASDIQQVLKVHRHSGKRWLIALVILLLLVVAGYIVWQPTNGSALRYEFAEVTRGDLTVTVSATGTLQPVNQVDVGSELSGTIDTVHVNFNDHVKRGQVLARLNTDRLLADVVEARASLESDKAKLEESKATVLETRLHHTRCEKLAERKLCSQEDLDTAKAEYVRAQAVQASAKAQVAVATATLEGKETELAKAEIRSPIDGLVLSREVEPGQTVAASLQAPVLFTLAEDLAHMELHVAVDEADVGQVMEGQSAQFTVDAYADRHFPATITQVRFAPQTVDGVVTYETVLAVDNSELLLRPGMTATAIITVQNLKDSVLLPNSALRFTPPVTQASQSSGRGLFGALMPRPPQSARRSNNTKENGQKVWVLADGEPVAVPVKTGVTDGRFTQLLSGELQPGQSLIIDTSSVAQ